MWWRLLWWVISFAISDYFRQRLPAQTASGIGDFNIPTATEGRSVPIIPGGTPRIRAPNCIHYSDFAAVPRTITTGVIFKEEETIGFTYELALVYALLKGEVAGLTGIWIGEDKVFDHVADAAGVPQTVVDIDRDDLFGGVDDGGGFVGRFRLFNGAEDQAASSFLQARVPTTPAYRGTAYVVISDLAETKGANIGEAPNLRHITYEVQAFDTVANGGLGDVLGLGDNTHFIGPDANPISVAYDLWTNQRWGRGRPVDEVDATNFAANAATVHTEGLGFTMLIDEQTTTDEIQDIIEQHIDGYIGPNPLTGKIEVKLARPDYVLANEFQVDASNLRGIPKWNKGDWSQTFNRVRIRYTDRAKNWTETHAVEVAPGNRIIQGATLTKEVRYPGCHTAEVASKLAAREKRNLAQPASSGQIEVDRTAWEQRPGDVMSFTSPKVSETDLAVRITKAQVGNVIDNTMVFDVIADVFGPEISTSVIPPVTDFVPPVQAVEVLLAADQAAFEPPFTLMRYDAQPNTVPRITTLARAASGSPTEYEVIRRVRTIAGSGSYGSFASSGFIRAGFAQVGTLRAALPAWTSGNGTFSIEVDPIGSESLDNLIGQYSPGPGNAGGLCIIEPGTANEEWLATSEIIDDGDGISLENVFRSSMDTPMLVHALGARVWFVWTGGMGMPLETYDAGNGVEVKLLPRSPTDAIIESEATALPEVAILDTVRHARPLLPRTLDVNASEFPASASADFIAQADPEIIGLLFAVAPRMWNTQDILWQVRGLDQAGGSIGADDWALLGNDVEWWLYDLDTTPTPVRDVDDILTGTFAWDVPTESFIISRDDLIAAGVTATFAARIEIEVEHSPSGQTANQLTRLPMFVDFTIAGTFPGEDVFPYSAVSFHSHFDGADAATAATDESDTVHTITFNNAAQLDDVQKVFGPTSLWVAASIDYASLASHADFAFGTGNFTIEFRFRPTIVNTQVRVVYDQRTGLTQIVPTIYYSSSAGLVYHVNGATRISGGSIVANTWYTVAVSRKAGTTKMFLDGVQIGSDFTDSLNYIQSPVILGQAGDALGSTLAGHQGWIEEVRILKGEGIRTANYTIDADEFDFHRVELLAGFNGLDAATAFTSEDRYLQAFTFQGNAQLDTAQQKFGDSSLLLDGTGDYLTLPDSARWGLSLASGDFTWEGFIRLNAVGQFKAIVSKRNTGTQHGFLLWVDTSNILNFIAWQDSSNNVVLTGTTAMTTGVWYHVAAVRTGTTYEIALDGVSEATVVDAVTDPTVNTSLLMIGRDETNAARDFNGWIDEVRYTRKALYVTPFTPPAAEHPRS